MNIVEKLCAQARNVKIKEDAYNLKEDLISYHKIGNLDDWQSDWLLQAIRNLNTNIGLNACIDCLQKMQLPENKRGNRNLI